MPTNILPDSRLSDRRGSVMLDWPLRGGPNPPTVRLECVPCFCINCGAPGPYVPADTTSWASFLCQKCIESYGELASGWVCSEQAFCEAVAAEMLESFGRYLTELELCALKDQGKLGRYLELLERDSPYKWMLL